MISSEITNYIQQMIVNGKPESKIREELIAFGWPEREVDEALSLTKSQTDPLPNQSNYKEETIKKFQGQISPSVHSNPTRLGKTIFLSIIIIAVIGGLYYALSLLSGTPKTSQPTSLKNETPTSTNSR
ncbi:MAG: hypothetical protein HY093_03605 [Candidatus Liptonbacteria bacterium]|nr:hypothetical protein [Candidatus Liptonbacteria bacterium]